MSFLTNCIKYMINTRILNYEAYDTMVSKHWLQDPKEFNYMIALTWKVLRGKNFNSTQFLQNKSLRMYNQMSPNKKVQKKINN